ncbi:MAG: hypothetical protein WCA31_05825 [Acidimicrobiales bacterium]
MIEFVEECRREWKRLGVPDPIANEMALDLTTDIEEAEADGGSAEDVLGNSLFDPRRFAAAWASARGVTSPPAPVDPFTPLVDNRHPWYRPALIVALSLFVLLTALAAAAALIGRHGVAVAATIGRTVVLPQSPRWFGPAVHPMQTFVSGPSSFSQGFGPFAVLALVVLVVCLVTLGLAVLYRISGPGHQSKRRIW